MTRLFASAVALIIVLTALPAAAAPAREETLMAQASAPRVNNPDFMGMVIRDPWYDFNTNKALPGQPNRVFQDTMGVNLANIGVRWVRLDFHIPLGYNAPLEQIDAEIAKNDYFINEVAPRQNLKVLALLSFDLVQGFNARELNSTATITSPFGGGVNVYMQAWLTRALRIADRYRDRIGAYELLNEENRLPQHGGTGPAGDAIAPAITARLLTKFYRFCKNIEPNDQNHGCGGAPIILGGLHPRGTSSDPKKPSTITMTDEQYLEAVYNVQSAASPFSAFRSQYGFFPVDGIGFHPYPEEIQMPPKVGIQAIADDINNKILPRISQIRTKLGAVQDPNKPIWITEIGYNVAFPKNGGTNAEPLQAEFMRQIYSSLFVRGDIANVFWFKYEDFPPASGPDAQKWGVVRINFTLGACPGGACYDPSGQPNIVRPSYLAYRELAGLPPIVPIQKTYVPLVNR